MIWRVQAAAIIATAVVLSACGSARPISKAPLAATPAASTPAASAARTVPPQGPASPARTAPPSALPSSGPLIAVLRDTRIVLVDLQGRDVTAEPDAVSIWAGAGGDRAAWIGADGVLRALHRDGSIEQLEVLPKNAQAVISPDGSEWLWSKWDASGTNTYHSTLYLTTATSRDLVVEEVTEAGKSLQPYRWDGGGALVQHGLLGVGGYIVMGFANGDVDLIDAAKGRVAAHLSTPHDCWLAARAADGTVACETYADTGVTLTLLNSNGAPPASIPLARPRFNAAGNVSFKPGRPAPLAAVGGAEVNPGKERYATDLVTVAGGGIQRFGPDGIAPASGDWAWLPDGSLIGYGGPGAGSFQVFVTSPAGVARQITTGLPMGVIR